MLARSPEVALALGTTGGRGSENCLRAFVFLPASQLHLRLSSVRVSFSRGLAVSSAQTKMATHSSMVTLALLHL